MRRFRTQNDDKSVLETNDKGQTARITYPNGDSRGFKYDAKGQIVEKSFQKKGETEPTVLKRQGNTDWWTSNKGDISHSQGDKVEKGVYSSIDVEKGELIRKTDGSVAKGEGKFDLAAQKKQLEEVAGKLITNPQQREQFKKNMETFEKRAADQKIPESEVGRTYNELARLMLSSKSEALGQKERVQIAQQAMRQAADPTTIDQGMHPTCNVATVEVNMYMKEPSKAVKVVADVATARS